MHQKVTKSLPKGAKMPQKVTKRTQKGTPRKQLQETTTENTPLGTLSVALEAFWVKLARALEEPQGSRRGYAIRLLDHPGGIHFVHTK